MEKISIGVLTVSDRCSKNMAVDTSGPNLIKRIQNGLVKKGKVVVTALVPDNETKIKKKLIEWCDEMKLHLILTTGGTGIAPSDVTPEATVALLDRLIPGISHLMFKQSSEVTSFAALSRGVSGVRGRTLIINLPGSKKAAEECLESVSCVIPHALDLINDVKGDVEKLHVLLEKKTSKVEVMVEERRKRKSPWPCLKVSEAQDIILDKAHGFRSVKNVDLEEALGYVVAENVHAIDNLPPFDASIKDGYAVISTDKTTPKKLLGSCAAGFLPDHQVVQGTCVSVNTGAPIPKGADAVVQVEDTCLRKKENQTEIDINAFVSAGENIRPRGFDFSVGSLLLPMGTYLGSSAVGLLAAAGVLSVKVYNKPTLAVMSTGDEIVDPRQFLGVGKVRDSNRITLMSMLKEEGFVAHDLGIVKDEPDALYTSLAEGFAMADIVVTTGSMSMGDRDYLKDVLIKDFAADIFFGAVFMKPGKPTAFAVLEFQGKPKMWFGLPGNPASAVVTTHLFLFPALKHVSGNRNEFPPRVEATLTFDIELLDRPHYHRGVLLYESGKFSVLTTGNQSSSRVGSCTDANCLIEISHGTGIIRKGTAVNVILIGNRF